MDIDKGERRGDYDDENISTCVRSEARRERQHLLLCMRPLSYSSLLLPRLLSPYYITLLLSTFVFLLHLITIHKTDVII